MSGTDSTLVHGTAVALDGRAVLIRGASGSGKSDLALRFIALCGGLPPDGIAILVADDQVEARVHREMLVVSAPATIAGQIEVRGIGITKFPYVASARLALVADLVPTAAIVRMPEPEMCEIAGISVPLVAIAPFESSAAIKLRLCLACCTAGKP